MDINGLKQRALKAIEDNSEQLINIGNKLYSMPEVGFKEYKTSAFVKKILQDNGLNVEDSIALTGLKAVALGKNHKANVAVIGELDSLIMPNHTGANYDTGAFHACGHHAQLTTIIGVAIGLIKTNIINELDGDLTFFAVPAEEVIELDFRRNLQSQGKLRFLGGKQEFISLGYFDNVDITLCSHILGNREDSYFAYGQSYNGMLHKLVSFIGKSSHAGLVPDMGINALHAAVCAINNINAIRESFCDMEHVRIHYIITKGGDSPNIVPDDVCMEFGIRAVTAEMMMEANRRVNRALRAGAEALGAKVQIHDIGAYLPLHQDKLLGDLYGKNAAFVAGEENVEDLFGVHRGSSSDAGDIASLCPVLHPYFGGAIGTPHTDAFEITNDYVAYVTAAKAAALTVIDLLCNDAKKAVEIRENYKPTFKNKEQYLSYYDCLLRSEE